MSGRLPDMPLHTPVNLQDWQDTTFLHWDYPPDLVQRLLPPGLRVQQWGGVTWIGVIPFRMANVRGPGMPVVPGWKAFAELNVRAYVTAPDGSEGIWFLGMLVARSSFALALRTIGLPYWVSNSEVRTAWPRIDYRFGAPGLLGPRVKDWFTATVEVGAPLTEKERTPLVDTLTGRFTAFHRRGIMWQTPVEHQPWPLHRATVDGELTAPLRWVGLPEPDSAPMIQSSPGVNVKLASLRPAPMLRLPHAPPGRAYAPSAARQ
ncbi:DUF2071 domain-containing protein [Tessaracoccus sp. MC1865]|uniref:YqjF family protein n=1 Tax=Tessaracoccus sp. MC1865 TaxID=2760310 RepID=UPI001600CD55|nr:DUF2071 domain-containing protein [Tessaracoccus sp. MC1865]MBB1482325.1 DUF2071 domain-containing protein [Tessaracoccus sp. MC1865]QTO38207.1 DUF2071 domain-containing protein [Tessaracoccus sp. MC1865]